MPRLSNYADLTNDIDAHAHNTLSARMYAHIELVKHRRQGTNRQNLRRILRILSLVSTFKEIFLVRKAVRSKNTGMPKVSNYADWTCDNDGPLAKKKKKKRINNTSSSLLVPV